jgi:transposase
MLNARQQRFVAAYAEQPTIARAARLAGVHRASVYRWKADPDFEKALDQAFQAWSKKHRERLAIEDAARAELRRRRELELLPMKIKNLKRARDALARKRGN